MTGISKLLSIDGYIQVNKMLIKKLGLHEAIIIGELCAEYNYWEEQGKLDDDMFYSTRENIENNTGLNEHYQRKAITTLKDLNILSTKRKGLPAVTYYKIHFDKLLTLLSTSSSRDAGQDVNSVNLNNNKQTNIEENKKSNSKELLQNFQFGGNSKLRSKESLYSKCVSMIDDFISKHNAGNPIRNKLIAYLHFRLQVKDKPLYANMWKGMLNKLDDLHRQGYGYEPIIDYCLERGYLSFYPPAGCYDDRRSKPWEDGVSCEQYTDEEKEQLEQLRRDMESKGLRTVF